MISWKWKKVRKTNVVYCSMIFDNKITEEVKEEIDDYLKTTGYRYRTFWEKEYNGKTEMELYVIIRGKRDELKEWLGKIVNSIELFFS